MNLAIEYVARTKIGQAMLRVPFSLMLQNVFDNSRLIVSVQNCYGQPDHLLIKHWKIKEIVKDKVLPPVDEFVIKRDVVFSHARILIEDYRPLEYGASPYQIQSKQSADEPYASRQAKGYEDCLDQFFNAPSNDTKRMNWLWESFSSAFFPKTVASDFGRLNPDSQRSTVRELVPVIWKGWGVWTEQFLTKDNNIASEIVYHYLFEDRLSKNVKYQEIVNAKEKEKNKKKIKLSNDFFNGPSVNSVLNFATPMNNMPMSDFSPPDDLPAPDADFLEEIS